MCSPPSESMVILERIPQTYTIDSHEQTTSPVGRFGRQLGATFNFIVANKGAIERNQKVFDRVAVRRNRLIAAPLASAIAVATEDEKELGVAVIDLGAGTTNVCIMQDNVLRHVAVIPMGVGAINKDIRSASIPDLHIEELKVSHGYAVASAIPDNLINKSINIPGRTKHEVKQITFRDLSTIIEARMLDIIEYVIGEIKDSGMSERLASGIVLTGGGSLMAGIDVLFKERTGYEVRLASADFNISDESKELVADPRVATAAGLLLLTLNDNLLSAQSRTTNVEQTVFSRQVDTEIGSVDEHPNFEDREEEDIFMDSGRKRRKKSKKKRDPKPSEEGANGNSLKDKINKAFTKWFSVVDDEDESFS